jgi:hypothetical protein
MSTKSWNASHTVASWCAPVEPPPGVVAGSLVEPELLDVILGRGMLHVNHSGNLRFYAIIDSYIPRYQDAEGKFMKGDIIHAIYKEVRRSARFVREEPSLACCVVVDEDMARKKIGHAMRYRIKRARLLADAWVPTALPPDEAYSQEDSIIFIDEDLDSVLGSPSECAFLVNQETHYFQSDFY